MHQSSKPCRLFQQVYGHGRSSSKQEYQRRRRDCLQALLRTPVYLFLPTVYEAHILSDNGKERPEEGLLRCGQFPASLRPSCVESRHSHHLKVAECPKHCDQSDRIPRCLHPTYPVRTEDLPGRSRNEPDGHSGQSSGLEGCRPA